jgi:Na+/phosphate symporter
MEIDIKKVMPPVNNEWDAINEMVKAQQAIIEALHIMNSVLENREYEYQEIHAKRIKQFISKYEKDIQEAIPTVKRIQEDNF